MPPITRYFVRRRNWRWSPGNDLTPRGWVCFPGPGHTVAEFDHFDDAQHDWGKREAEVRRKFNPFECGPLSMVSSLPEPILRDFLKDTGIEPPEAGIAWDAWWPANRERLSEEQQARVWEAVDKVRFFEITEETAGAEVHVVVDVLWERRDELYVAEYDGGELIRACRYSQRAGEIARGRSQQRRFTAGSGTAGTPLANCRPSNVPDPFTAGSTRLLQLLQAPFSEVLTVPFDDTAEELQSTAPFPPGTWLNRNERLAIVLRLDFAPGDEEFRSTGADWGVPIKAYADWEKAKAHQEELVREAQRTFNPFSISTTPASLLGRRAFAAPEPDVLRLCAEIGLPPSEGDWRQWWAELVTTLPEIKRDLFWREFKNVQFYSVVSVQFEP
ncbi:MAG: hypothetical protein K8U57_06670 [Planctomycetes bacterium]|nr:hypothetical protein [Planctomycetota bacterium]